RKTHLPAKVAGTDKDKNTKTVVLTNMQTDVRLPGDTFELKPGFGWTVNTQPLPRRSGQNSPQSQASPLPPGEQSPPLQTPGQKRLGT
ncbi:MAG: hypothetical protein MUP47_00600, partial [Phycisphaerae bacterium]|nr:hypothetical protein [Phycisphaerae bacterium]